MLRSTTMLTLFAGVLIAGAGFAQAPAGAPAGSTGVCRDGSYWSGATKKGACRGHKGVQDWYAGMNAPAAPAPTPSAQTTPAAATPATPAAPAPSTHSATKTDTAPAAAQAPGGGPGLVWVNSSSKVYHCQTDRWYGKTKSGAYMSEADAIAKGNRADHHKACNK